MVALFKALAEYCEKAIDNENMEAPESVKGLCEASDVIEYFGILKVRMHSDTQGFERAVGKAKEIFDINLGHHI